MATLDYTWLVAVWKLNSCSLSCPPDLPVSFQLPSGTETHPSRISFLHIPIVLHVPHVSPNLVQMWEAPFSVSLIFYLLLYFLFLEILDLYSNIIFSILFHA